MATKTEISTLPSTRSAVGDAKSVSVGMRDRTGGDYLAVALAIGLGIAIAWQATLAGQFLSGNGSALRLHEYGAYATFVLAIATVIVEVASGWRRHRWGLAMISGLLAVAIMVQIELGYLSADHAANLAYHVPLGVSIAGLYVWFLTMRLHH